MKSAFCMNRDRPILLLVYRSLKICFIALALIIIGGTIYIQFFCAVSLGHKSDKQIFHENGGQTFTGIGRIRVSTQASVTEPHPGMVIIFVLFDYPPDDKAFSEELALKVKSFRDIITDYIGTYSTAELKRLGEENLKSELLRRINAVLRLGHIDALYFSDFLIIG